MSGDSSNHTRDTGDQPAVEIDLGKALLASLDAISTAREQAVGESSAYLLVFSGRRMPAMFPVGDSAVIGRSKRADICIEDDSVSRRHVRVSRQEDGTFLLEDLGSRHGTRINGERMRRHPLASGDRLQLGGVRAVVVTFQGRFEELLLELQSINAIHSIAIGAALGMGSANRSLRETLHELRRLVDDGAPEHEPLGPLVDRLEQGLQQHEDLADELMELANIGDYRERRIPLAELLQPVFRAIPFPVYPHFQLITEVESGVRVTCNPDLLRQAVMELAINAVEAMPEGGELRISARRVELEGRDALAIPFQAPGPNLRLVVADSGVGMPPECSRRAFEPFFSTKSSFRRSGLGLTRVQHIVRSHLGQIDLTSTLGEGTTVTIHIPLPQEEAAGS